MSKYTYKLAFEDDMREIGIFIEKQDGSPFTSQEYIQALNEYLNQFTAIMHFKEKQKRAYESDRNKH